MDKKYYFEYVSFKLLLKFSKLEPANKKIKSFVVVVVHLEVHEKE